MQIKARTILALCLLVPTALSTLGCSSSQTLAQKDINQFWQASNYCQNLSEVNYQKLVPEKPCSTSINHEADLHEFPSGKSYFKGYALPEYTHPYTINIKSFAIGGSIDDSRLFYPEVMLLDAYHSVTRIIPWTAFTLVKPGFLETLHETGGLMKALEASVPVRENDASDRFMIVYTRVELLQKTTPTETVEVFPIILPGLVGAIPIGKRTAHIAHSPVGHLTLEIREELGQ